MKKITKIYLAMVAVLAVAMGCGLYWVNSKCVEYQTYCAKTIMTEAKEDLEEATGLELDFSMIPTILEDDQFAYAITSDGNPIAKVVLKKTGSGIMGSALFERVSTESLVSYSVVIDENTSLDVYGQSIDYLSDATDFSLPITEKIAKKGYTLEKYKKVNVNWLYDISQVVAEKNGKKLDLVKLDDNTYIAVESYKGKVKETIRERAAQLARYYAKFMSNDLDYNTLCNYTISDAPMKTTLWGMDLTWFGYHLSSEVKNLKLSDPIMLGDRFALVNAEFDYYIVNGGGNTDISKISLSMLLYLCTDGYWRYADFENFNRYGIEMTEQMPYIVASSYKNGKTPYSIDVNRVLNCVTIYTQDSNGEYTVPVKAMICATGQESSPTPTGYTYVTDFKADWCYMVDGTYGQYSTMFREGGYLFHSICFTKQDHSAMLTTEYNMLGGYASLGCVRLQTIDARWIKDNCIPGTPVRVYDDYDNPGPLGKPEKEVEYISEEDDCGWDPTDPLPSNPWRTR